MEITLYSWRIYPHQQNTGGFFVAALERVPKPKTSGTKRPKEDEEEARQTKKPKFGEEAVAHPPFAQVAVEPSVGGTVVRAGEQADVTDVEMAETDDKAEKGLKTRPSGSYKEEPYTFIDPESEDLKHCL
jgi:multisite-specific tRNA:(cytosine-C5)-methyltransferase